MAAYASRGGMRSLVLIPEGKISWGKLIENAFKYGPPEGSIGISAAVEVYAVDEADQREESASAR